MDPTEITQKVKARFDHELARRILKEKYQTKMVFAHAGGMWRAGPELQSTIFTCGTTSEVVLLDLYGNPVKVDKSELRSIVTGLWQDTMDQWLAEYEELNKKR